MKISKALITAASPLQRKLPLQTLIDSDGIEKSVLSLLIQEVKSAGINDMAIIVCPGDEIVYKELITDDEVTVQFIVQDKPEGYAKALLCAQSFLNNEPFLHLVGDHLYIDDIKNSCAKHLVEVATKHNCSVSAVQATREHLIPNFGVIGGQRFSGAAEVYKVNKVIEKPTPTEAEQHLFVSGIRAGYYLCFFGMHVLTPSFMKLLEQQTQGGNKANRSISKALNELAAKEQYLAVEKTDLRIDLGTKYGLLKAQLALASKGDDRDQVLSELLELFIIKNNQNNNK